MSVEIYATLGEPHEVAATLSDLRYLVFQGMKGDTGDSAYEVAVALGFVGTEAEWIASLKGEKGDSGAVFLELKTVSNRQVITYNGEQITGAEIDAMYLNGALPVVEYSGHIFLPNKNCYNPGSPSARNTSFMFCRPVSAIETTFISVRYDSSVVNIINEMVYPYFDSGDDEGKVLTVGDDDTVHWETPQGGTAANAVLYTAQSLSDLQKAQARTNVGAGTYSKPASGIPASDLAAGVIPDISGKANAADVYTKTEVDQKLVGAMDYKGTKATVSALPTSGNETGDVWHITADGSEWAWNGSAWEELGSAVDLSGYRTASAQDAIDTAQNTAIAAKYTKPSGGIPASDLASAVQTSLGKADSAYQKPSGGIPTSDLASGVIPSVPQMATQANMSDWTRGKTVDAAVLKANFQGALQALENVGDAVDFHANQIGNLQTDKADKTEIPTKTSDLTNDSNFQTAAQVQSAIAAAAELPSVTASDNGKVLGVVNGAWAVKSDEGGSSVTVDDALSTISTNPVQNKVVKEALDEKQDELTFDSVPTENSTNPVTSGGVYAALNPTTEFETKSVSGNPVYVTDAKADAAQALTVQMQTVWEGSGDPSPTNVRPISGGTGLKVYVSPTANPADGRTMSFSWIDKWGDTGTVQNRAWLTEGELNVLTGELTVRAILDVFDNVKVGTTKYIESTLFSLSNKSTSPTVIGDYVRTSFVARSVQKSNYRLTSNAAEFGTPMCNLLKHRFSHTDESASWYLNGGNLIAKFPTSLAGTTAGTIVDYLTSIKDTTPLMIRIPLIEPETYQLTPQQVQMLLGTNYVGSDLGTVNLTYTARIGGVPEEEAGAESLYGFSPISLSAAAGWRSGANTIYSTNSHYHIDIPVAEGDRYHIKTRTNNANVRAAAFFPSDFSTSTESLAGEASGWIEGTVVVPEGKAYLTVNCAHAYSVVIEKYGLLSEAETGLPSYFQTEVADTVAKTKNFCGEKALVLAAATDSHLNAAYGYQVWNDTIKNIAAVNAKYPIDGIVHMGDIINGSAASSVGLEQLDMARSNFLGIGKNAAFLEGNHDLNSFYNSNADPINEASMFSEVFRFNDTEIVRPNGKLYGYRDYDALGIRVVYLHSSMGDGTHGGRGDNWGYPQDELTWVQNVALDTEYQVLFISHMPMTQGHISDASNLPTNGNALKTIVSDFIDNGGVVVGLLHGHTHWDDVQDNGKFKEVSIGCEDYTYTASDIVGTAINSYTPTTAVKSARMRYTVTQDLWDVVIVRPASRTVKLVRFGAGVDRAFSY